MVSHAGDHPELGSYATSRRGGLSATEIREIRGHRSKERPTPWQALAVIYGRSVADIKALFDDGAANDNTVEPAAPAKPHLRGGALWTKQNVQLLKLASEAGHSSYQIAEMIGCSDAAVRAKRAVLGISKGAVR